MAKQANQKPIKKGRVPLGDESLAKPPPEGQGDESLFPKAPDQVLDQAPVPSGPIESPGPDPGTGTAPKDSTESPDPESSALARRILRDVADEIAAANPNRYPIKFRAKDSWRARILEAIGLLGSMRGREAA